MAATYVTAAELKANLGIGTLYSDSIVEEVCQTAEDMLNSYLWFDSYPVVGATLQDNVATAQRQLLALTLGLLDHQLCRLSGTGLIARSHFLKVIHLFNFPKQMPMTITI